MINKELLDTINNRNEKYIEKYFNNIFQYIQQKYTDSELSLKAKIYIEYLKIDTPKCHCGKYTKFLNFKEGFRKYCSPKCQSNSKEVKERRKKTNIEKYGFENPMKNDGVRQKLNDSIINKYGVDNISKLDYIKDKVRETNRLKHGYDHPSQNPKNKKSLSLNMTRINKTSNVDKNKIYVYNKIKKIGLKLIDITSTSSYKILCNTCDNNFEIHKNMLNDRISNKNTICTICNPIRSASNYQNLLQEYISEIYTGNIIRNTRSIIKGELDIYLPDLKIAFEFNGSYWHSDIFKSNTYHFDKTNKCFDKGVQLIHIWEDQWLNKNDILKSKISNILDNNIKIYSHECEIREINNEIYNNFLNINYLDEYNDTNTEHKYGLYHNNILVCVISFNYNEGIIEICKFCNILYHYIIDGFSKLIEKIIKDNQPNEIIYYVNRCWSIEESYDKIGFKLESICEPNYFYIKNNERFNIYDIEQKLEDIEKNKYYRLYDSGSLKYILKVKKTE